MVGCVWGCETASSNAMLLSARHCCNLNFFLHTNYTYYCVFACLRLSDSSFCFNTPLHMIIIFRISVLKAINKLKLKLSIYLNTCSLHCIPEAADEAIRQRHGLDDDEPPDTKKRQQAITDIESEGFSQQRFSSSRHTTDSRKVGLPWRILDQSQLVLLWWMSINVNQCEVKSNSLLLVYDAL